MAIRDHRTKDQLHTWGNHRAVEPRHARWAKRRTVRVGKQARAVEREQGKRSYTDDKE